MSNKPEAEAKFDGLVSFPTVDASVGFKKTVEDFLEAGSAIFFEIQKNPMYQHTLIAASRVLLEESENFELTAIKFEHEQSQKRCREAWLEMKKHVGSLERVLLEDRQVYGQWSLKQAEQINLSVKGILGTLANLVEFNESDVINVVSENIQLCHKATNNLESAKGYFDKHKQNLTNVTDALLEQMENRAGVVRDKNTSADLSSLHRRIPPVIQTVLTRGTSQDYENLRKLLREAEKLFIPLHPEGDFSYRDVDAGAFNSAIDDLLNAIRDGSGAGIRDNAGRLGNQAKALDDANRALKEQTKRLVQAAANAVKNKDSDDAQKRLEELMNATKNQVNDLSRRQREEAERKRKLLKASAQIGVAIDRMQDDLRSYRDMQSSKGPARITSDLERKMQIQEEEERRRRGRK